MIIIDKICKLDGTIEEREIEVADDYFDNAPPAPTDREILDALLAKLAERGIIP